MSTVSTAVLQPKPERSIPALVHGQRLDQLTFHARYEAMPPDTRAELVGGRVYIMSSPVGDDHGDVHASVFHWLIYFKGTSSRIRLRDNTSIVLGSGSEVQPDVAVYSQDSRSFRQSSHSNEPRIPDLIIEVSDSTETYDLKIKKRDYEQAGVKEYLVVLVKGGIIRWFCLVNDAYEEIEAGPDGLYRSRVFPDLWLDAQALLSEDYPRLKEAVQKGLVSNPEQAETSDGK